MFLSTILSLLLACSKPLSPVGDTTVPSTVNKTKLLQYVNEVRKKGCKCGDSYYAPVPALTWNDKLEAAAYRHTKEMVEKKYFSHDSPTGTTPGQRIRNAGYKWTAYGENIASGYTDEKSVVVGWLASPGHCRNIMSKLYKEMGAAMINGYWTQDFGAR